MNLLEYIEESYKRTKFRFFSLVKILEHFGEDGRDQLNKLKSEGKIKRRQGANDILIEYLPNQNNDENNY